MSKNTNMNISQQEMDRYLAGNMSPAEKNAFEKNLLENPFEAEAMEGFESNAGSMAYLGAAQTEFAGKYGLKGIGLNVYKALFFGTLITGIVVIAFLLFRNNEIQKSETPIAKQEEPIQENAITENKTELKESYTAIETLEPIQEKEQIVVVPAPKAKSNEVATYEIMQEVKEKPFIITETMESKKLEEKTPEPEIKTIEINAKTASMHDLKVVDYSGFYTEGITKNTFELTGVTADKENERSRGMEPVVRTEKIPYENYLNESMRFFANGKYKTALKNYTIILDHYPDDLNASFYGGLCYYNLGKPEKAIEYFDKCILSSINVFKQEAEWCKALALIKKGETIEAKKILNRIIEGNEFYSVHAKEKLKELE